MDSPITAHHVSTRDVTLPSPSNTWLIPTGKRKKAKGKGKPNIKKQQAIEEKLQSLLVNLKPIPFKPGKIPNLSKHEKLLEKLGLWEFVNIDLDMDIRVDLVAQLIASYDPKNRVSKVHDYRIAVSQADFARAFKLLVKKKGNNNAAGVVDADSECEALSDNLIEFVLVLVDKLVLLHEDDDMWMWMMPNELVDWYKMIKDGHPEKVDWESLLWFMVENELKQGGQLKDCYYASHLQHLIKSQRKELFVDVKDGIYEEFNAPGEEGVYLLEWPSTKLTLGQDGEKEDEEEVMIVEDVDKCKENDCNEEEREKVEREKVKEEQGQWLLNGQNKLGFTGNLIQVMESNQMDFDHDHHHPQDDQLCSPPSVDIVSIPSFFNSAGKRAIEHDSNDINKKLRVNDDSWVPNKNKQSDFGMCLEQRYNMTERARLLDEEKERATNQSNMHQQPLLSEVEQLYILLREKDEVIYRSEREVEQLYILLREKDKVIYRSEREMVLMESVLTGYINDWKETDKKFSKYREKARVQEEPTYKDTGLGGLMLTVSEIEKRRKKQEDDDKKLRLMFEQKLKDAENIVGGQFKKCAEKVGALDNRLGRCCRDVKDMMKVFEE